MATLAITHEVARELKETVHSWLDFLWGEKVMLTFYDMFISYNGHCVFCSSILHRYYQI